MAECNNAIKTSNTHPRFATLGALKIRSTHVGPRFDCPKYFGTPEARGRRGRAKKDVQLYPPQKNVPNNKSKTETRILTIFWCHNVEEIFGEKEKNFFSWSAHRDHQGWFLKFWAQNFKIWCCASVRSYFNSFWFNLDNLFLR